MNTNTFRMDLEVVTISDSEEEQIINIPRPNYASINNDILHNIGPTICSFCTFVLEPGAGIELQCHHTFCLACVSSTVNSSPTREIYCPIGCNGVKVQTEIQSIATTGTMQTAFRESVIKNNQNGNDGVKNKQPETQHIVPKSSTSNILEVEETQIFARCADLSCLEHVFLTHLDSTKKKTEFTCTKCGRLNCLVCRRLKYSSDKQEPSTSSAPIQFYCYCVDIDITIPEKVQLTEGEEVAMDTSINKKTKMEEDLEKDWENKWNFLMSSVASNNSETKKESGPDTSELLSLSLQLEENELLFSKLEFQCPICLCQVEKGDGVILKECFHHFCKNCLEQVIQHSEGATISCPHRVEDVVCSSIISEREIKALISPEFFESFLNRSIAQAELAIPNTFHCRTANCNGWWELESDRVAGEAICPLCQKRNCLKCKAVHEAVSCVEYQMLLHQDQMDIQSKKLLQKNVNKGLVMKCPTCKVMIEKNGGCPQMNCTFCRTEFTWAPQAKQVAPSGNGSGQLFIPIATGPGQKSMSMDKLLLPVPAPKTKTGANVSERIIPGPRGGTSATTLRRLRLQKEKAEQERLQQIRLAEFNTFMAGHIYGPGSVQTASQSGGVPIQEGRLTVPFPVPGANTMPRFFPDPYNSLHLPLNNPVYPPFFPNNNNTPGPSSAITFPSQGPGTFYPSATVQQQYTGGFNDPYFQDPLYFRQLNDPIHITDISSSSEDGVEVDSSSSSDD